MSDGPELASNTPHDVCYIYRFMHMMLFHDVLHPVKSQNVKHLFMVSISETLE